MGQREHCGQARGGIGVIEHAEGVIAQFVGEPGQQQLRVGVGAAGDDAQRQREPAAQPDEFVHRRRFGVDVCGAEPGGEQCAGLAVGEGVDEQVVGAVPGDQARQPVAAGDHHGAPVTAWQQGSDLGGVGRVVEHQQHPLVRHQAAEQCRLRVRGGRDAVGLDAQRVEESAHRHGRVHRVAVRAEAPQVDEELPIGELIGVAVSPVQREPRLAHPAGAGDRGDDHRGRLAWPGPQCGVEPVEFEVAAHERRRQSRQLTWGRYDRGLGCARRRSQKLVQFGRLQIERRGQLTHRRELWVAASAGLQAAYRADRNPRKLGQGFLGQPRTQPKLPNRRGEVISHGDLPTRTIATGNPLRMSSNWCPVCLVPAIASNRPRHTTGRAGQSCSDDHRRPAVARDRAHHRRPGTAGRRGLRRRRAVPAHCRRRSCPPAPPSVSAGLGRPT